MNLDLMGFILEIICLIANIFRLQAYDSVMCRSFCIGFIDIMLKGNNLTDFTNLFSPYDFKKMMI